MRTSHGRLLFRGIAVCSVAVATAVAGKWILKPYSSVFSVAYAQGSSAMVVSLIGAGTFERQGKKAPLRKGTLLEASDVISISAKSAVKMQFEDGSSITLFEGTDLVLEKAKLRHEGGLEATINVLKGKVRFFVKPKSAGNQVKFKTSNAIMGVRGTSGVIVSQGERSELFVTSGQVDVVASGVANGLAVPVGPGLSTLVLRNAPPTAPKPFEASAVPSDPFPGQAAPELETARPSTSQEDDGPVSSQEEDGGGNAPGAKEQTPSEAPGTTDTTEPASPNTPPAPVAPEATDELPGPSSKTLYYPDGTSGVVVRAGGVDAMVPSRMSALDVSVGESVRQSTEFARSGGVEAGRAVEQATRDALERAQGAAPPALRRRIPVDIRVEGWK